MAKERATSQEAKVFADQMIADHIKTAQDMAPDAQAVGVTPRPSWMNATRGS